MYTENDDLKTVPDECVVRRYMSLTKFLSILERQALFFPSLELLAKEDKFEGLFNLVDHPFSPKLPHPINNNFSRDHRRHFYVNCWNYGPEESYALWKIYLSNSNEGIAIETEFSRLKKCFNSFPENIYIGKVNYATGPYFGSRFFTCTTKRSSFMYEQEIRVIYENIPCDEQGNQKIELPALQGGYDIPINPQILFDRVITSPFAPSWFHDLVGAIMNRYGYSKVVVKRSRLAIEPI